MCLDRTKVSFAAGAKLSDEREQESPVDDLRSSVNLKNDYD